MRRMIILLVLLAVLCGISSLWADLTALERGLIRLHVVGATDSYEDQAVKLRVKDAVAAYLQDKLIAAGTREDALAILRQELSNVELIAIRTLAESGFSETVTVTLGDEEFPRRQYDTFSLPSGVYQSLRIRIGQAQGKNWWCVVFPGLCVPAVSQDLRDTAVGAGFSEILTDTITEEYEMRFFLLDCLGQLQNFFHRE